MIPTMLDIWEAFLFFKRKQTFGKTFYRKTWTAIKTDKNLRIISLLSKISVHILDELTRLKKLTLTPPQFLSWFPKFWFTLSLPNFERFLIFWKLSLKFCFWGGNSWENHKKWICCDCTTVPVTPRILEGLYLSSETAYW